MLIAIWDTSDLLIAALDSDTGRPADPAVLRERFVTLAGEAAGQLAVDGVTDLHLPDAPTVGAPVLKLTPLHAIDALATVSPSPDCGDALLFWARLAGIARSCVATHQFYPSVRREGDHLTALWQPLVGNREEVQRLEKFALAMPAVCRATPWLKDAHPLRLVETFLSETTDSLVRRAARTDEFFLRVHQRPAALDVRWLSALLGDGRVVEGDDAELRKLADDVYQWLTPITDAGEQANARLGFRMTEPPPDETGWLMEFRLVGEGDEPSILTAENLWKQQASPLTSLGRTIGERQTKMLADLKIAAEHFPPLERVLPEEQPTRLILSPVEAFAFMRSWAVALEDNGFHVDVPDWATPDQGELSLRLALTPADHDDETLDGVGPDGPHNGHALAAGGRVGLDSLVRFDWRVAVGQQQLTPAEFEQLVAQQSPLVRFRDRWIQIDLEAAKKAQEAIAKNSTGKLTLGEAFRVAYGLAGDAGVPVSGLSGADWIDRLLSQSPDSKLSEMPQPPGFLGELRPYQLRGLQWMAYLDRLGLGACLADDMGLGKTIQFISLLLQERLAHTEENGNGHRPPAGPTLLFAPASVIGNWVRELERFAPTLKVLAHHGPERLHGEAFAEQVAKYDVILTGYALAHRDQVDLRRVRWHRVAMDEAQKVKNAQSAASAAIRSLTAGRRVALTGTPIENHLSELWSIMEVLNPGLLGTAAQFRERFVIPVERMNDPKRGQLLRELIRPFVLRRTKQDPEVAVNLPSKMEMRVFTSLKPEQAAMYERITADMLTSVENASGIRRRGLILAGLTRLKQVCDHPALLTPDNKSIDNRSGKAERLVEMLEEVIEEGEAALVFTQYREMGHLLEKLIRTQLNQEPLFLHGGVPVKDRDTMIQEFQRPGTKHRIFILSLRAGGLGLNLTAANHVFHYDRWWNPAVEAQATDRAHRIGQTRIVQVHKFVSIGTVEERIDKLLADKTALAENIVTSGDQWLTNLSTDDLKKYLALSNEAVEE
ncbi:MAG TPA: DEAD/DEAH box helicase [Tepidisphaeraceae bacterium]|jgi:hypothetical protein